MRHKVPGHEQLSGCCLANAEALEWYMSLRVRRVAYRGGKRPRALLACGNCGISRFHVFPVVAVRGPRNAAERQACCDLAWSALAACPGVIVEPVDGRDRLPHQALVTCGFCLSGAFWLQPSLPRDAPPHPAGARRRPRRQPRLSPARWWER